MSPMETRAELARLVEAEPGVTAASAAARLGVSRQRVYALAHALGLRLAPPPLRRRRLEAVAMPPRRGQISTVQGRVTELVAASDLVARGWLVYWPLTGAGPDLLIVDRYRRSAPQTVEVRPGRRESDGTVRWQPSEHHADLHVIVVGTEVLYRSEAAEPDVAV